MGAQNQLSLKRGDWKLLQMTRISKQGCKSQRNESKKEDEKMVCRQFKNF